MEMLSVVKTLREADETPEEDMWVKVSHLWVWVCDKTAAACAL